MAFECKVSNRSTSCVSIIQPYWFRPDGALELFLVPRDQTCAGGQVLWVQFRGFRNSRKDLDFICVWVKSRSRDAKSPARVCYELEGCFGDYIKIPTTDKDGWVLSQDARLQKFSDWTSASVCFESALMKKRTIFTGIDLLTERSR